MKKTWIFVATASLLFAVSCFDESDKKKDEDLPIRKGQKFAAEYKAAIAEGDYEKAERIDKAAMEYENSLSGLASIDFAIGYKNNR